jgi:uncharacterized membrane protein
MRRQGRLLILREALSCAAAAGAVIAATIRAPAQDCRPMATAGYTDCSIGEGRISGQQSEIAAGTARLRASQERLRTVTGGVYEPKPHKTKPRHKAQSQ